MSEPVAQRSSEPRAAGFRRFSRDVVSAGAMHVSAVLSREGRPLKFHRERSRSMPGKRAHVKNEKQYEALKDKGMSKEAPPRTRTPRARRVVGGRRPIRDRVDLLLRRAARPLRRRLPVVKVVRRLRGRRPETAFVARIGLNRSCGRSMGLRVEKEVSRLIWWQELAETEIAGRDTFPSMGGGLGRVRRARPASSSTRKQWI